MFGFSSPMERDTLIVFFIMDSSEGKQLKIIFSSLKQIYHLFQMNTVRAF